MTAAVESVSPAAGEGGGAATVPGAPHRSVASRLISRLSSGSVQIVLIVVALLWMVPIFGLLVSSFRSAESNSDSGWWHVFTSPSELTLANYADLLSDQAILTSLWNTVLITVPSTVLVVGVGALAAYALTWIKFPGRDWVMVAIVGLLVVPVQLALIPIAAFYKNVGLFGTIPGIVLFHTAFGLPFAIFLLRNYFLGIPTDLLEAARMDGGSEWSIFRRVVLPIALPALASLSIFQFLWVWNDFLVALVFGDGDSSPMTLFLQGQLVQFGNNIDVIATGSFVSMVIPLVVFFSFQRYFVQGVLTGSTK